MKKPLHRTTNDRSVFSCSDSQCYVTALRFKTMLPYTNRKSSILSAAVSLVRWLTFHSSIYVLFHFQSSNSLMDILEYHSSCIHVNILGKLFSIPCGREFYSPILKIGQGKFIPHPIVHKKTENIR